MAYPYVRNSEAGPWGLVGSEGQLGKPGAYQDPGLWEPIESTHTQFFPQARMTQDAQISQTMGDTNPQNPVSYLIGTFQKSLEKFSTITTHLLTNVDRTWRDPDTGDIHFGTGEIYGRTFDQTVAAGAQWLQQMRGLFNWGYDPPKPILISQPGDMGTPVGQANAIKILGVVLLILWALGR